MEDPRGASHLARRQLENAKSEVLKEALREQESLKKQLLEAQVGPFTPSRTPHEPLGGPLADPA